MSSDMKDLVERLRKWTNRPLLQEAASALAAAQARIAELEADNARLLNNCSAYIRLATAERELREVEARYLGEQERALTAERERDEARKHHQKFFHGLYADMCKRTERAERERDEARKAAWVTIQRVERERDEARAALKEIATTDNGHAGIIARHALSPSPSAVLGGDKP